MKSGLAFFILKSYVPLQRYLLTCQANSASLANFLHWAAAVLKGQVFDIVGLLPSSALLYTNTVVYEQGTRLI